MHRVTVKAMLTENGEIIVDLPPGWKAGEVEIKIPLKPEEKLSDEKTELKTHNATSDNSQDV